MAAYIVVQIKITRPDGWPEYREEVSRLAAEGTSDAGRLGVHPRSMAAVLGVR